MASASCRGSGAEFEAISTTSEQDVQCGVCELRFTVRVARRRDGSKVVRVPNHEERNDHD